MKRVIALLLAFVMTLTVTDAGMKGTAKAITGKSAGDNSLSNPSTDSDGVTSWDSVYFGKYWQNDTNGDGFADKNDEKTPIQWRVLSVENDEIFLLADKCLECQPFHDEANIEGITWETCSLRKWLNENFYDTAFTDDEKGAIIKKTLANDSENRKFASCNDTQDNVALLSWDEAYKEEYAISESNINLETKCTDYALQKGLQRVVDEVGASEGITETYSRTSSTDGYVFEISESRDKRENYIASSVTSSIGIRPIIYIKKSSSLWKKTTVIHNFEKDYEPTEPMETPAKGNISMDVPIMDDEIVHSGKDGDISWSINASGCLKLEGNGDWKGLADSFVIVGDEEAGLPKWLDYSDDIIMAQINITGMTNCKYMFDGCSNLIKMEVKNWDTSKVTDMGYMFRYCKNLQSLDGLENLNTANVKNMEKMFYGCEELSQFNLKFDTSNVTTMRGMFAYCTSLEEIDLSYFATPKLESMSDIFEGCDILEKINMSSFDLSNCNYFSGFERLYSLVEIDTPCQLQNIFAGDKSGYDTLPKFTSNYTPWQDTNGNTYQTFPLQNKSIKLTRKIVNPKVLMSYSGISGNLKWNVDNEGKLTIIGEGDCKGKREKYPSWNIANRYIKSCVVDVKGVTDASYMFADLPYLEEIIFDDFDTSQVTNMEFMFCGDCSLKALDVSGFDTSNVEEMYYMFAGCSTLTEINIEYFRTEKVNEFDSMFEGCRSLKKLDFRNMDTQCVNSFQNMFLGCSNLEQLQLSSFCTDNVNRISGTFECCHRLTNLDLSGWNLENVPECKTYDGHTGWPTFLEGTTYLSQIKTPLNLKVEVKLPKGNWTDESGKSYTALPVNQSKSLLLKNSEKLQYEPTPTVKPTPIPTPPSKSNTTAQNQQNTSKQPVATQNSNQTTGTTPKTSSKVSIKKSGGYTCLLIGDKVVSKYKLKKGVLTWKGTKKSKKIKQVKQVGFIKKSKNLVYITKKGKVYTISKNGKTKTILKKGAKNFVKKNGFVTKVKKKSGYLDVTKK